ncbi:DUF4382 domain-containing protein [Halospeciosus flavus]|uniref:DUF4382 domain-containing protein n=1 Tax=Halospeciosus flavus TaxID=3032283 RepID=A0ABD5Z4A4_9EURY|nr:DUF4382 domain-containing protein [Halospeciosus flavus]
MSRTLASVALVLAVVLAGCAGVAPLSDGDAGADTGTVSLYLSDETNAIDDFRHLNVTVTKVGLKKDDGNWSGHHGDHEHHHRNRWTVADVDNRTVDLTRLQGQNATLLGNLSVENGTYEKAFVYVSDVNATLANGSTTRVDLPRDRLKVKDRFRVQDGRVVDFVVDVTVVNRSGEYVLVPRASASGEDVSFCRIDDGCGCDGDGHHHDGTNETDGGHHHGGGSGCDGCDGCGG